MKSLGNRAKGERRERMRRSPQWDGRGFGNHTTSSLDNARDPLPLREFLCPVARRTPLAPLPSIDPTESWSRRPESSLRVTWLGHSTTVIEIAGRRILTDPVWSKRASPSQRVGPKRFQPVPVSLDRLPALDLVMLSHDHYDHLDFATIRILARSKVPFVTTLGVGAHLESWGIGSERITELDWWERASFFEDAVAVTATPAQHFSGRSLLSRNQTLWSSFVIEGGGDRVFFGGDSGLMTGFEEIGTRYAPFDLVMLEIGAYHPAWATIHLGPVNAITALRALGGGPLLPIHWGTFDLSTHRWDQPIRTLVELADRNDVRLLTPRLGEASEPRFGSEMDHWWETLSHLHGPEPDATMPVATPPPVD